MHVTTGVFSTHTEEQVSFAVYAVFFLDMLIPSGNSFLEYDENFGSGAFGAWGTGDNRVERERVWKEISHTAGVSGVA